MPIRSQRAQRALLAFGKIIRIFCREQKYSYILAAQQLENSGWRVGLGLFVSFRCYRCDGSLFFFTLPCDGSLSFFTFTGAMDLAFDERNAKQPLGFGAVAAKCFGTAEWPVSFSFSVQPSGLFAAGQASSPAQKKAMLPSVTNHIGQTTDGHNPHDTHNICARFVSCSSTCVCDVLSAADSLGGWGAPSNHDELDVIDWKQKDQQHQHQLP